MIAFLRNIASIGLCLKDEADNLIKVSHEIDLSMHQVDGRFFAHMSKESTYTLKKGVAKGYAKSKAGDLITPGDEIKEDTLCISPSSCLHLEEASEEAIHKVDLLKAQRKAALAI